MWYLLLLPVIAYFSWPYINKCGRKAKHHRNAAVLYMINTLCKMADESHVSSFTLHKSRKAAVIKYPYMGVIKSVIVPYDNKLVIKMHGKRVYLVKNNLQEDITQQLGVCYPLQAKDLAADYFLVEDSEGLTKKYSSLVDIAKGDTLHLIDDKPREQAK